MAISEAKALVDTLKVAGALVSRIHRDYYRASDEMEDFPRQVQRLSEIAEEWEEHLKKFHLPTDCHVQTRLDTAKELLEQEVERMDQINHSCCLMLCNKVVFPDQLTSNMKLVIQCFDDIPKTLQERRERDQLVQSEANRVLAPFSFTPDKKYVPMKTTVEDLRRSLQDDTSDHNVVLLHGESGQGKTTLAKYLALLYHQESSLKITSDSTSAPSTSRYFSEVHFIACGKNADSTFLMKKLWSELGYQTVDESGGVPLQTMEGGEQAQIRGHPAIAKSEIETTRRKIMARLENREKTLIVLDDVWEQSVVQDLHISHKSIKYLITTQKSHLWPDVVRSVPIANPTPEEAKCILANHIVGWVLDESFPPEVQEEVDRLVREVDRNPFILATIATSVTSKGEAMDPQTWKELRRNLVATLKQLPVDDSAGKPIIFGESYGSNVVASMTMAIDSFTEKTRILFFLVVLFTEQVKTVEKIVLQVLFKAFFGTLFNFRSSFQHLANSSFVSINTTELPWRQEPFIGCSTHDLRRHFVGEMKQAEAVIQKLVSLEEEIHPDEDEKELSVVICYLYGNQHCRRQAYGALRKSRFEICADLQRDEKDESWINTNAVAFVRSWILLLAPDMDDNETETRWEKQRHETAKKVILHLLKCGELHDEEVANLLRHSRTRLDTCYVLGSYAPFASGRMSIPVTVEALLETVKDFVRMKDVSLSSLGVMTNAMESILVTGADAGIHAHIQKNSSMMVDILKGYIKMLADESNPECQSEVAEALEVFTSSKEISKILAACTEALDILVRLINQRTSLFILEGLTNMFDNILRKGMEVEEGVNSNYINRVIENYIAIGSSTENVNRACKIESTRALCNFTWERLNILELLMMHLVRGEIETLVFLNLVDKKSQSYEVSVVGLLFYRILVESEAVDVKFQSNARENLISEVLKCFIGIFVYGIESESRIEALQDLSLLAESEEIRKLIVVNVRVIETAVELLQGQVSSSDLIILTDAIYNIYALEAQVDLKHIVPLRALTSILETYIGFLSLADDEVKLDLQTEAVRALGLFARRDEIRRLLMADLRVQDSLGRLLWTRKDVSPLLLRRMADLLFSFFVRRTEFATDRENDVNCPLILKALESFSRILMEDFKPEVQSEAIRGLGMLAARPDIRELIVGYQGALMRSVELLTETATTSILSNVRDAVDLISAKGPNPEDLDEVTADFRSATLRGYVAILRDDVPIQLQLAASRALSELLVYKGNRRLFSLACPDGLKSLKFLLDREDQSSSDWPFNSRYYASVALTLIDPSEGSDLKHSAEGNFGRGRGQMVLGMFENAVVNFDKAIRMVPNFTLALWFGPCSELAFPKMVSVQSGVLTESILRVKHLEVCGDVQYEAAYIPRPEPVSDCCHHANNDRAAARVQLGNAAGALEDLNRVLLIKKNPDRPFYLQERGVVKRIMGDHEGALADFNKSLALRRNDYEVLKQRGYVKFLLGDETGARADAERAILVSPVRIFRPYSIIERLSCLGMWPVEFLGFQLR